MVARRGWLLAVDGCLLWMVARCGWLLAVNGCDLGQERRRDNSIILLSHDASYYLDDTPYMIRCIVEVVKAGLFSSGQVLARHSKVGSNNTEKNGRNKICKISRSPLARGAKRRAR